jgi:nicotinate-nucleotide pyrophosphorylase (carboxylating)
MSLPKKILEEKLRKLVEEDVGHGDVTTSAVVAKGTLVEAKIMAKEKGTIAGIEEAILLAESFGLRTKQLITDGQKVRAGTTVLQIHGDGATALSVERTLLNLLSRMSGIATATRLLVEKIRKAGYKTRVAATRKTAPGLSYFDKKAVMVGGGDPHRSGLDDMILVKDNHVAIAGDLVKAVKRLRGNTSFSKKIEVEVTRLEDALDAARNEVDIIMLDNFTPAQVKEAVRSLEENQLRARVLIEASGGINEKNVLQYAATGVDIVSVGEITHSPKAVDLSLEITKVNRSKKLS